jgi:uncharacterized protein involved in outer membrane biogenesis
MRKFLIGLGALALVVAGLILVLPSLIDVESRKAQLVAKASQAIGRPLRVDGPVSFRILPSPALTAGKITLGSPPGFEAASMVEIERLALSVDLLRLLKGQVALKRVTLENPRISLEILPDGRANWELSAAEKKAGGGKPGESAAGARPSAASEPDFRIDELKIRGGRLVYNDRKANSRHAIDEIDLSVAVTSLIGPFKMNGRMRLDGAPVRFDGGLDTIKTDRASPLRLEVALPTMGITSRFNGVLSVLSGGYTARGSLSAEGGQPGETSGIGPALSQPFIFSTQLSASAERVELREMQLSLGREKGRNTGQGHIVLDMTATPRLDARLAFDRIDIDAILAQAKPHEAATAKEARKETAKPAIEAQTTQAAEPSKPFSFALPRNVSGSADVTASQIVFHGKMVSEVRLSAALAGGELTLNQAQAALPQGGEAQLFGFLNTAGAEPLFEGNLETRTANLRETLIWLGLDAPALPADRLKAFSLKAGVRGTPREISLTGLDARLDESRLLGAATFRPAQGGASRHALGLSLSLDQINLDSYLAQAKTAAAAEKPGPKPATAQPAQPLQSAAASPASPLDMIDANIKAKAGRIVHQARIYQDVVLDGALLKGDITLREAGVGDVLGSAVRLSGGISQPLSAEPRLKDLTVDVRSRSPAKLAESFAAQPAPGIEKLGPAALRAKLNGTLSALSLDGVAEAAGLALKTSGQVQGLPLAPRFDLALDASHANLAQLLRLFAESYRPAEVNPGPLALSAKIKGDAKAVDISDLRAKLGKAHLSGKAALDLTRPRPRIAATLVADELVLDPFLPPRKAAALPAVPAILPAVYRLGEEEGRILRIAATSAAERWSREPLEFGFLKAIDGTLDFTGQLLALDKWRIEKPIIQLALENATANLARFSGGLYGGQLAMSGKLTAADSASLALTLAIAKANVRQALFDTAGVAVADGQLDLNLNVAAKGRSMAEMIAQLNGEGNIAARNGQVEGFDLKAVSQQLSRIENIGKALSLLQGGMQGGRTRFSTLDGTFKIQNGVATSQDLRLIAEGGQGGAQVAADLPRWLLDARSRFQLTEISGAPGFGMRLEGPLDNPRRIFEANELISWLANKGLGQALKGKGGKGGEVLQQILGGGQPAAQPPAGSSTAEPAQEPPPEKASKQLRGLLKGLGR